MSETDKPPITILFPPGITNDDERRSQLREKLTQARYSVEFREGVAPGGSSLGEVLPIVVIVGYAAIAVGRATYVAARPFTNRLLENLADIVTDIVREDYLLLPKSQDDNPKKLDFEDARDEDPSAGVTFGLDVATGEQVGKAEFFPPEQEPDEGEWKRPN